MRPVSPRFIACTRSPDEAQVVFFGVPFEGTVNLRKGADRGPLDLRLASDSIETYSPALGRDLEDLAMADLGDCELPDGSPRSQLEAARQEILRFWRPGLRPVMLGGDHTATLPVIEVLAAAVPEVPSGKDAQSDAQRRVEWLLKNGGTDPAAAEAAKSAEMEAPMPGRAVLEAVIAGERKFTKAQLEFSIAEAMVLTGWQMTPLELTQKGEPWLADLILQNQADLA